ncbi:hypothetical protein KJ903_02675 [Patescibacteria group bacterium]|nr:hypothetical protein [Patescibacteria group bacterium]
MARNIDAGIATSKDEQRFLRGPNRRGGGRRFKPETPAPEQIKVTKTAIHSAEERREMDRLRRRVAEQDASWSPQKRKDAAPETFVYTAPEKKKKLPSKSVDSGSDTPQNIAADLSSESITDYDNEAVKFGSLSKTSTSEDEDDRSRQPQRKGSFHVRQGKKWRTKRHAAENSKDNLFDAMGISSGNPNEALSDEFAITPGDELAQMQEQEEALITEEAHNRELNNRLKAASGDQKTSALSREEKSWGKVYKSNIIDTSGPNSTELDSELTSHEPELESDDTTIPDDRLDDDHYQHPATFEPEVGKYEDSDLPKKLSSRKSFIAIAGIEPEHAKSPREGRQPATKNRLFKFLSRRRRSQRKTAEERRQEL